ncbi:MAG: TolC family protein [Cyclobacteriaceae bacterium]|jgi:multidrug efflux system outer membrane protein
MRLVLIIISLGIAIVLLGCRIAQPSVPPHDIQIPQSYLSHEVPSDSLSLAAQPWQVFIADSTLRALIDSAVNSNFDARIGLQRIEQARASLIGAKGQLLPVVSAGGMSAIRRFGLYTMDGAGNATTDIRPGETVPTNLPDYFVGLQSSWEVDISGKLRNQKRSAAARVLASEAGRQWVVTNLVAEIATTYYELLALDLELEIITATVELQEDALRVVTIQKENAVANELVVNQFQAQLLNTRALEIETRQFIVESENRINLLLGRFPQPIKRNPAVLEQQIQTFVATGVPAQLLQHRPDLRAAEFELVAAKADLRAARASFFPSLNITAGAGFQAYRTDLLFQTPESIAFSVLGGLWAPLLNRSAIQARFKGANAYQTEALLDYQQNIVVAYTEVFNELSRYANLGRMYAQKEQEAQVLTRAITTAHELYRTGRANYLEVLLTQQNALEARVDLVEARKKQYQSLTRIYRSLGGGWR